MSARQQIADAFPRIDQRFEVQSPITDRYNCIAWAAGDATQWWWPAPDRFWPHLERTDSLGVFIQVFQAMGFECCGADEVLEVGFEKVAIYARDGRVKHMARQTQKGAWLSKLGEGWDIVHVGPNCVAGDRYGEPVMYMKRAAPVLAYSI